MNHGDGTFPSITFHQGQLWLVYQQGPRLRVLVDGVQRGEDIPTNEGAAFPVIGSHAGAVFVAWKDGNVGRLLNLMTGEARDLAPLVEGNHGMLLWESFAFYQAGGAVHAVSLEGGDPFIARAEMRGTGIVRIVNGWPIFWDEDRFTVRGMTQPTFAGQFAAGEGPAGGALVVDTTSQPRRELLLWPGTNTVEPVIAADTDSSRLAVATWGDRQVRAEIITPAQLVVPQPDPVDPDPVDPEEPEKPTMSWPNLLDTVKRVRAKYPEKIDWNQSVAIVNEVCWVHKDLGMCLLRKDGGNHGAQPNTGIPCSVDWFCQRSTALGIDGLYSTPNSDEGSLGIATPQWGDGKPVDVSQLVDPVDPGVGVGGDPGDENDAKKPHAYVAGDHDGGTCDLCGQVRSAAIHQATPPGPVQTGSIDAIVKGLIQAAVVPLAAKIAALEARPAGGGSSFPSRISLKTAHGKYVAAEADGALVGNRDAVGEWEQFEVEGQG